MKVTSKEDAGGTSTCYITVDKNAKRILLVNYWDSSLTTIKLDSKGNLLKLDTRIDLGISKKELKHSAEKHVDHSRNDEEAIKERMSEPHTHALVLDPFT